jgi:hypothetical protein
MARIRVGEGTVSGLNMAQRRRENRLERLFYRIVHIGSDDRANSSFINAIADGLRDILRRSEIR